MRQCAKYGRGLALGIAATMGVWSLQAEAVTYNVTIVQFEQGIETTDFNTGITTGQVTGVVKSSNLPLALTTSSASYFGSASQSAGLPNGLSGGWTLADGAGNSLSGDFNNLTRYYSSPGSPMPRGTGSTTINSGIGVFEDASGGGTFEVFARDYGYFDSNTNTSYQAYQQVMVNHLQITLPNGPVQTDTRNVAVSVRIGMNDRTNETGVNIGGPTYDDAPLSNPRLTQVRSEYEYGEPGPLHDGLSFARNIAGDGLDWAYQFPSGASIPVVELNTSFFFESYGTARVVRGHGFYEGYTGESEWQAWEGWMFDVTPERGTYSNVVIDRYTLQAPVPEPETYAMMFVGLAVLGIAARRRRTRF
jgi:hypothetical protein